MASRIQRDDPHTPRFKSVRAAKNKNGRKFGPNRSENYLDWIRKRPCCVCSKNAPSEASHHGRRGMGQKASDFSCVPLCTDHHRDWHTYRHFDRIGLNTPVDAELHVLRTIMVLHDEWLRMEHAA